MYNATINLIGERLDKSPDEVAEIIDTSRQVLKIFADIEGSTSDVEGAIELLEEVSTAYEQYQDDLESVDGDG